MWKTGGQDDSKTKKMEDIKGIILSTDYRGCNHESSWTRRSTIHWRLESHGLWSDGSNGNLIVPVRGSGIDHTSKKLRERSEARRTGAWSYWFSDKCPLRLLNFHFIRWSAHWSNHPPVPRRSSLGYWCLGIPRISLFPERMLDADPETDSYKFRNVIEDRYWCFQCYYHLAHRSCPVPSLAERFSPDENLAYVSPSNLWFRLIPLKKCVPPEKVGENNFKILSFPEIISKLEVLK